MHSNMTNRQIHTEHYFHIRQVAAISIERLDHEDSWACSCATSSDAIEFEATDDHVQLEVRLSSQVIELI